MVLARHMSRHPPAAFACSLTELPLVLPLSAGRLAGRSSCRCRSKIGSVGRVAQRARVASDLGHLTLSRKKVRA